LKKEHQLAIIGAGQLGSRHLQAFATVDFPISIQVVDPSSQSLKMAKERFEQMPNNQNVNSVRFLSAVNDLEGQLDFCIIASNANVRMSILKELFENGGAKNLLLEKVLFQSVEGLKEASDLLKKHNARAWVNCNKRLFPIYQRVKELLQDTTKISYLVDGGDWGLGSNAIHFLDQVQWLTGSPFESVDNSELDYETFDSKRKGFKEFFGTLKGRCVNGSEMILTSQKESQIPWAVTITAGSMQVKAQETSGILKVTKDGESIEETFLPVYQSNLTQKVAKSVLQEGNSELATYEESASVHHLLLKSFLNHLDRVTEEKNIICPIT
jgi:predicted dehydrogenase